MIGQNVSLLISDWSVPGMMIMLFSSLHHLLKIVRDKPACNIPGVANTTMGPGLSIYDLRTIYISKAMCPPSPSSLNLLQYSDDFLLLVLNRGERVLLRIKATITSRPFETWKHDLN